MPHVSYFSQSTSTQANKGYDYCYAYVCYHLFHSRSFYPRRKQVNLEVYGNVPTFKFRIYFKFMI